MAYNKKSFVLYSDQRSLIDLLSDEQAGKLLKHIFAYVNDENPITDDKLMLIAFEPIKQQLKRDLVRWEQTKEGRSKAGKASAEAKKNQQNSTNSTNVNFVQQSSTNSTVNDNVNVNVNVNVKDINNIDERKLKFASTLKDYLSLYGKDLLNDFHSYWTEPNKSKTKMRFELEKTWDLKRRLDTWVKNDKKFNYGTVTTKKLTVDEQLDERKQKFARELIESIENSTNANSQE
jgi:hypothetical protein